MILSQQNINNSFIFKFKKKYNSLSFLHKSIKSMKRTQEYNSLSSLGKHRLEKPWAVYQCLLNKQMHRKKQKHV